MRGIGTAIRLGATVAIAAGLPGCGHDARADAPAAAPVSAPAARGPIHPDEFARPVPPRVVVPSPAHGAPVTVACATCHDVRPPDPGERGATLESFHTDLVLQHGDLACLACHHADDYDALRRADGTRLAYAESMQLCGQCHARQARDWTDGLHGGMNGHWDRSVGPRRRHHCLVCHDPHAPAFPAMQPTFKPRDRFLGESGEEHP